MKCQTELRETELMYDHTKNKIDQLYLQDRLLDKGLLTEDILVEWI
ncbi:hypothetical protein [Natranaerobius trueperi]|nr:hypothetical protein [Natranaerobius trueperi]